MRIFWKAASTLVESNAEVSINDNSFLSAKIIKHLYVQCHRKVCTNLPAVSDSQTINQNRRRNLVKASKQILSNNNIFTCQMPTNHVKTISVYSARPAIDIRELQLMQSTAMLCDTVWNRFVRRQTNESTNAMVRPRRQLHFGCWRPNLALTPSPSLSIYQSTDKTDQKQTNFSTLRAHGPFLWSLVQCC